MFQSLLTDHTYESVEEAAILSDHCYDTTKPEEHVCWCLPEVRVYDDTAVIIHRETN